MMRSKADQLTEVAPDVYCLGPRGRTQTNVYFFRSGASWFLVDAGWPKDAPAIERAAGALFDRPPAAILLTHYHPDHAGAALPLACKWNVPVYLHPLEMPLAAGNFDALRSGSGPLDRWLILPILRLFGRRRRDAVLARSSLGGVARALGPKGAMPGLPEWQWIATPGHTPGHVSFFRERDRVLVSGDALVTLRLNSFWGLLLQRPGLSGPPWYTTWSTPAAAQSVAALAALRPAVLLTGHGAPMAGSGTAAAVEEFARAFASERAVLAASGVAAATPAPVSPKAGACDVQRSADR